MEWNQINRKNNFYENHSALINYIRDEVSSEFYSFIVDILEIQMGAKIGSGCSCDVYKGECRGKSVAGHEIRQFRGITFKRILKRN